MRNYKVSGRKPGGSSCYFCIQNALKLENLWNQTFSRSDTHGLPLKGWDVDKGGEGMEGERGGVAMHPTKFGRKLTPMFARFTVAAIA